MNEQFDTISEIVEGPEFRFHVNLAAGYGAFKRLVREQDIFPRLKEFAKQESGADIITKRIEHLLEQDYDSQYQHPRDTAIAAYLYALEQANVGAIFSLTSRISDSSDFWWARKIAKQILAEAVHVRVSQETQFKYGDLSVSLSLDLWLSQYLKTILKPQPRSNETENATDSYEIPSKDIKLEIDAEGANTCTEYYEFPTTPSFKMVFKVAS